MTTHDPLIDKLTVRQYETYRTLCQTLRNSKEEPYGIPNEVIARAAYESLHESNLQDVVDQLTVYLENLSRARDMVNEQ